MLLRGWRHVLLGVAWAAWHLALLQAIPTDLVGDVRPRGRGDSCAVGGAPDSSTVDVHFAKGLQWRRYGPFFPGMYLDESIRTWLFGRHNRFEVQAGLCDGGYLRICTHAK
jgi:hypothetical protein